MALPRSAGTCLAGMRGRLLTFRVYSKAGGRHGPREAEIGADRLLYTSGAMAKRATKRGPSGGGGSGGGSGKSSGGEGPGVETRAMILHGKDPFLRSLHTDKLREVFRAAGVDAEVMRFDGGSAGVADVLDECRTLGLMQQHKIVVVDEADEWLKDTGSGARARDVVERYLESPSETATLVLRAETWHKGKIDNLVAKCGCVIKCEKPDDRTAASWAVQRAQKRYGVVLEREAAGALVSLCGAELGRLDTEIAKLSSAAEGGVVTAALVREMVGYSREQAFWDVQEALLSGDAEFALRKVRELMTVSRLPATLVRYGMLDLSRKLHAASRMLAEGAHPAAVSKELKLWGVTKDPLLDSARRCGVGKGAAAVRLAVGADVAAKTGFGDEDRGAEVAALGLARLVGGGR